MKYLPSLCFSLQLMLLVLYVGRDALKDVQRTYMYHADQSALSLGGPSSVCIEGCRSLVHVLDAWEFPISVPYQKQAYFRTQLSKFSDTCFTANEELSPFQENFIHSVVRRALNGTVVEPVFHALDTFIIACQLGPSFVLLPRMEHLYYTTGAYVLKQTVMWMESIEETPLGGWLKLAGESVRLVLQSVSHFMTNGPYYFIGLQAMVCVLAATHTGLFSQYPPFIGYTLKGVIVAANIAVWLPQNGLIAASSQ